jgi:hypothetical protein
MSEELACKEECKNKLHVRSSTHLQIRCTDSVTVGVYILLDCTYVRLKGVFLAVGISQPRLARKN